ncbi:hypothetical protein Q9L58_001887 [Maublancomyces gigas]|uniref:Uncharacterized protein n=1 Tax=Discina gigas TaxID=1032678 RepID=A0ABR3GST6_9PEZI
MALSYNSFETTSTAMSLSNDSPESVLFNELPQSTRSDESFPTIVLPSEPTPIALPSEWFPIVLPSDQTTLSDPSTITAPPGKPPSPSSNPLQPTPAPRNNITVAIAIAVPILVITISILAFLIFRRRAKQNHGAPETVLPELDGDTHKSTVLIELSAQSPPRAELPGTTPVSTPSPPREISPTPPPWAPQPFQHLPEHRVSPAASPTPPIAPEDDNEIQSLQRERVRVGERRERLLMLEALDEEDRRLEQKISERMTGLRGGG